MKKNVPFQKKKSPVKKGRASSSSSSRGGGGGGTHSERILGAVASEHSFGNEPADKAVVQGMSMILDKKVFSTVCATMRKAGLVEYDGTTIALTGLGRALAGEAATPLPATNARFHEKIRDMLGGKKPRDIFDILSDGQWHSKESIAAALDMEVTKSFGTYLSALSRYTERCEGGYRLKDSAFPCGRPDGP